MYQHGNGENIFLPLFLLVARAFTPYPAHVLTCRPEQPSCALSDAAATSDRPGADARLVLGRFKNSFHLDRPTTLIHVRITRAYSCADTFLPRECVHKLRRTSLEGEGSGSGAAAGALVLAPSVNCLCGARSTLDASKSSNRRRSTPPISKTRRQRPSC